MSCVQIKRGFHTAKLLYLAVLTTLVFVQVAQSSETPLTFSVSVDEKLIDAPATGRVILFISDQTDGEPRTSFNWLSRQPIFAQDVHDLRTGTLLTLNKLQGFPYDLTELPPGKYAIQAVLHTNPDLPHSGTAGGNLCSEPVVRVLDPATSGDVSLTLTRRIAQEKKDIRSESMKSVTLRSDCLSKFYGREVQLRALVVLPEAYTKDADRHFPAIYAIPGFGGDEHESARYLMFLGQPKEPFVRIGIDGMCGLGHHVYADSANNGPWGRALVDELIPHLEKEFRLIREPWARFLTGHSSGGWSALWVQISHPTFFGGVWATSPDSVDFHDFSGIDIYASGCNLYKDANGNRRPVMRQGKKILLTMEDFARKEDVIGPGGQLASFEAVFSPRGPDGRPRKLWDRRSGQIDSETAEAWRRYDIVDKLKREWKDLSPHLAGKITVVMGEDDNFYLNGATSRLKTALEELGSDARIFIMPDCDHGSIMRSEPARRIMGEISAKAQKSLSSARTGLPTTNEAPRYPSKNP